MMPSICKLNFQQSWKHFFIFHKLKFLKGKVIFTVIWCMLFNYLHAIFNWNLYGYELTTFLIMKWIILQKCLMNMIKRKNVWLYCYFSIYTFCLGRNKPTMITTCTINMTLRFKNMYTSLWQLYLLQKGFIATENFILFAVNSVFLSHIFIYLENVYFKN